MRIKIVKNSWLLLLTGVSFKYRYLIFPYNSLVSENETHIMRYFKIELFLNWFRSLHIGRIL